jgi:putative NADPH-quinone reductase
MPATTKGFLDRVLTKGIMFDEVPHARGNPLRNLMPRLSGVTVLSVMATPDRIYRGQYQEPLTKILFEGTFGKIGIHNFTWTNCAAVATTSPEQRQHLLDRIETSFARLEPSGEQPSPATVDPAP